MKTLKLLWGRKSVRIAVRGILPLLWIISLPVMLYCFDPSAFGDGCTSGAVVALWFGLPVFAAGILVSVIILSIPVVLLVLWICGYYEKDDGGDDFSLHPF